MEPIISFHDFSFQYFSQKDPTLHRIDLEIYPGADRTSLMLVLPHQPGSLYKLLSRFYALGININKLESRPMPERNFEFMFYFDLETSVYSPEFLQLMAELPGLCDSFSYLGSYSEVI